MSNLNNDFPNAERILSTAQSPMGFHWEMLKENDSYFLVEYLDNELSDTFEISTDFNKVKAEFNEKRGELECLHFNF